MRIQKDFKNGDFPGTGALSRPRDLLLHEFQPGSSWLRGLRSI